MVERQMHRADVIRHSIMCVHARNTRDKLGVYHEVISVLHTLETLASLVADENLLAGTRRHPM